MPTGTSTTEIAANSLKNSQVRTTLLFCNHLTHSKVSEVPYFYLTGSGSVAGLLILVKEPYQVKAERGVIE